MTKTAKLQLEKQKKQADLMDLLTNWELAKRHPWYFLKHFTFTKDEHDPAIRYKRFPNKLYLRILCELWYRERSIAVPKSRQMIVSWTFQALGLWDTMFGTDDESGEVAYNKATNVQSKKQGDADNLLDRQKLIYGRLHAMHLVEHGLPLMKHGIDKEWGSFCEGEFPETGGTIRAFPQGADIARQYTASYYIIDEAAFQVEAKKAHKAIKPTLGDTGRITLISTPNGAQGEFFHDTVFDVTESGDLGAPATIDSRNHELRTLRKVEPDSPEERQLLEMDQTEFSKISIEELCAAVDGLDYWVNEDNGFHVLRLHYSADPDKNSKTARGRRWIEKTRKGMPLSSWRQEYEIDFRAFSGRVVIENWRQEWFVADLQFDPRLTLYSACDIGTDVAVAAFGQKEFVHGVMQARILAEVHLVRRGGFMPNTIILADRMVGIMEALFPEAWESGNHKCFPDPNDATKSRSVSTDTDDIILRRHGFRTIIRKFPVKKSTDFVKLQFTINSGVSGFLIDPRCRYLIDCLAGGWHYPEGCADGKPEHEGVYIHGGDTVRYLICNMIKPRELVGQDYNNSNAANRGQVFRNEVTGRIEARILPKTTESRRALEPEFLE